MFTTLTVATSVSSLATATVTFPLGFADSVTSYVAVVPSSGRSVCGRTRTPYSSSSVTLTEYVHGPLLVYSVADPLAVCVSTAVPSSASPSSDAATTTVCAFDHGFVESNVSDAGATLEASPLVVIASVTSSDGTCDSRTRYAAAPAALPHRQAGRGNHRSRRLVVSHRHPQPPHHVLVARDPLTPRAATAASSSFESASSAGLTATLLRRAPSSSA